MRVVFFIAICLFLCGFSAQAQNAPVDQDDVQSWNDVQLNAALSKHLDLFAAGTLRINNNVTRPNDRRFSVGVIYKPNKAWSFQPFYLFINARNSRNQIQTENRFNLRVGYQFPIKKIGLSHRSAFEYRLRQPQNSFRYRPSLTIDKDIPKNILSKAKIYLTEEIFYDSLPDKFSRHRVTVGVTKTLTKKLSLELYYMKQNDGFSRPGDLSVIGTNWKIRL